MDFDTKKFDELLKEMKMKREIFDKEFLEFDKSEHEIYVIALSETQKAVSKDDLDRFLTCTEFFQHAINSKSLSFERSGISLKPILTACKFGADKILRYLLGEKGGTFLKHWPLDTTQKPISPGDQDEETHNAFYYAIRSGKVEIVELLINYWSINDEIYSLLAIAMECLRLRNVQVAEKMDFFISSKITEKEFFYKNNKNKNNASVHKTEADQLGKRIEFLLKNLKIIFSEYKNNIQLDQKFFYLCQNVAKNIYILKRQLKATYIQLPWEEIEFCVITFASSHSTQNGDSMSFLYRSFLTREKLMRHLNNFHVRLSAEKHDILRLENRFEIPKMDRITVVSTISSKNPEFVELYDDFEQIRDICSLNTINELIETLSQTQPDHEYASAIVNRVLQVTGECMKNTLESPKLSQRSCKILEITIPKNTFSTITRLRNSFSHAYTLSIRSEIVKKTDRVAIENLQNDLKKVQGAIKEILLKYSQKVVILLLNRIIDCKTLEEYFDISTSIKSSEKVGFLLHESNDETSNQSQTKIRELVQELESHYQQKTQEESEYFKNIYKILKEAEKEIDERNEQFFMCFMSLTMSSEKSFLMKDLNALRAQKWFSKQLLDKFNEKYKPVNLQEIACYVSQIDYNDQNASNDPKNEIMQFERAEIAGKICQMAEISPNQIKWVENLIFDLNKVKKFIRKPNKTTRNMSKEMLLGKLNDLKKIVTQHHLSNGEDFSKLKRDNNIQLMVEMILLDIMSSLETSQNVCLTNNLLFLDGHYPVILGRELRNHLAHGNSLTELLPFQADLAIVLNCIKMVDQSQFLTSRSQNVYIGRVPKEDIKSMESKFENNLAVIQMQEMLFSALSEGNWQEFQNCCKNGADIYAKTTAMENSLHLAAKGGNLDNVKYLIEHHLDLSERDSDDNNALHISAAYGHSNLVKYFIKEMIMDVNEPLDQLLKTKTPLHMAAENGHLETVKVLVKYKADKNVYYQGVTPLALAALNNHMNVVQFLFENSDSNLSAIMMMDFTLLHYVAERGLTDMVKYLIENKADVNRRNEQRTIPLHTASLNGHLDIVNILLQNGSEVNARNLDESTPLHYSAENGHLEITKLLLKYNADPNIFEPTYKNTPLLIAAMEGFTHIIEFLLQYGAKIDARNHNGMQAIHLAAGKGDILSVKLLLEKGVNIDASSPNLGPPLNYASLGGHLDLVQYLVKSGANLNSHKSNIFPSPIKLAIQNGHKNILEYLLENGAHVNQSEATDALLTAVKFHHYELIEFWLEKGARTTNDIFKLACTNVKSMEVLLQKNPDYINSADSNGLSLLHLAVIHGQEELVELLVKQGCDVNKSMDKNKADKKTGEPIMFAVMKSHTKVVEILLKNGAEVTTEMKLLKIAVKQNDTNIVTLLLNHKNAHFKETEINDSLLCAVLFGFTTIASYLLSYKFLKKTTLRDTKWENEIMCVAAKNGHYSIIEVLVAKGLSVNPTNHECSPLLIAVHEGHLDVVDFLVSNGADVDYSGKESNTPLHIAAKSGYHEIVEILLRNNAKYVKDDKKRFPVELAVAENHLVCVDLFVQYKKVDFNVKCDFNGSLLYIAAQFGHEEVTKYLVDLGANIHIRNELDSKPIHIAAREGHIKLVEYYLSKGLNINEKGNCGTTLLHLPALYNQTNMIAFLIDNGADVNAKSRSGHTPLDLALQSEAKDAIKLLINMGAISSFETHNVLSSTKQLFSAIKTNSYTEIEKLIKSEDAQINAKNSKNETILHHAAWKGYIESVKVILKYKGNPNVLGKNNSSPLHFAAKFGHLNIVRELLAHGAIYDLKTEKGQTPLDICEDAQTKKLLNTIKDAFRSIQSNSLRIINELNRIKDVETQKAIANAQNNENRNILVIATRNGFPKLDELFTIFQDEQLNKQLRMADEYLGTERFHEGLHILLRVYEIRKNLFGTESPAAMKILHLINKAKYKQFKYDEVFQSSTEMYEIQKKVLGESHWLTNETNSLRGLVLHRQGKNENAYQIMKVVCETQKNISGANNPEYATSLNTMGLILFQLERFSEALEAHTIAYNVHRKLFGANGSSTLSTHNNIGLVLMAQEKYEEAIKVFEDVYNRRKLLLGPQHSDTLRPLQNISGIYFTQKKYNEASRSFEKTLELQMKHLGPNHSDTLHTKINLGKVFIFQGKAITALKLYNECLPKFKAIVGPFHPTYIEINNMLNQIRKTFKYSDRTDLPEMLQMIETKYYSAASNGDIATLTQLIDTGVDVNISDSEGRSGLQFAVHGNHEKVVVFLLSKGANPTVETKKGNTTLHAAVTNGNEELVKTLINHVKLNCHSKFGGFINAKTTVGGSTALHVAAKNGLWSICLMLLKYGAIFNLVNAKGETPLSLAKTSALINLFKSVEDIFTLANKDFRMIPGKLSELSSTPDEVFALANARNGKNQTIVETIIGSCKANGIESRSVVQKILKILNSVEK